MKHYNTENKGNNNTANDNIFTQYIRSLKQLYSFTQSTQICHADRMEPKKCVLVSPSSNKQQ